MKRERLRKGTFPLKESADEQLFALEVVCVENGTFPPNDLKAAEEGFLL